MPQCNSTKALPPPYSLTNALSKTHPLLLLTTKTLAAPPRTVVLIWMAEVGGGAPLYNSIAPTKLGHWTMTPPTTPSSYSSLSMSRKAESRDYLQRRSTQSLPLPPPFQSNSFTKTSPPFAWTAVLPTSPFRSSSLSYSLALSNANEKFIWPTTIILSHMATDGSASFSFSSPKCMPLSPSLSLPLGKGWCVLRACFAM